MVVYSKTISNSFCLIDYDISNNSVRNRIRDFLTKKMGGIAHNDSVYLLPNTSNTAEIIKSWAGQEGVKLNIWTSEIFNDPQKLDDIRNRFKEEMKERLKEVKDFIKMIEKDILERLPKDDNFKGYTNRLKSANNSLEMAKEITRRYGDEEDHIDVEALASLLEKTQQRLERAKQQRLRQAFRGENLDV